MALVKLNNRGVRSVSTFGSISSLGTYTFIKKLTASSSATLSFEDGSSDVVLDNTYKEYLFTFNNMHPATDGVHFQFQGNASGGSGYNETISSTSFSSLHKEDDGAANMAYRTAYDLAQSTSFQTICSETSNSNDSGVSGYMYLFNPSDTTYVTHFIANSNNAHNAPRSENYYVAGYFNLTSAIDEIQFKFSSGNIDAGKIKLYGIKDS